MVKQDPGNTQAKSEDLEELLNEIERVEKVIRCLVGDMKEQGEENNELRCSLQKCSRDFEQFR